MALETSDLYGSSIFQQHHIEGENNKVRSVSLSSYEPLAEKDATLLEKKRDILAVCLAHLVVIWTVVPGLQWTVLHKWSLPTVRKQLIEILFSILLKLILILNSILSILVKSDAMTRGSLYPNYQEEA